MELFEHVTKGRLSREEAADRLRRIADDLSVHNEFVISRGGARVTMGVPDEVDLEIEVEITDGKAEIEIELSW